MSDGDGVTRWPIIGTLVAELLFGRVFELGFKPIDRACRRLPRRVQWALTAALLAIAAAGWIYGCSRPGFR